MYLAADIGATNARFCLTDGQTWLGESWAGKTAEYQEFTQLLEDACAHLGAKDLLGAVLAVAGPVADGVCQMTNVALRIDANALAAALAGPVGVVNVF